MPQYTYHCENCDHQFDQYQSFSENPLLTCPQCSQDALLKVYKPALVVFKGKGFYVTDTSSAKSTLDKPNDSDKSSDNGKTETKTETKSEKNSGKKEDKKAAPKTTPSS